MKKILSAVMAILILAATFVSCKKNEDKPQTSPTDYETSQSTVEETQRLTPDLPDVTFDGAEYKFYSWDIEGWRVYEDIYVEDPGTEAISVAVYKRNSKIEEKYDVHISYQADYYTTYYGNVIVNSFSHDYLADVLLSMGLSAGLLMRQGCFYNLYNVPYIDMTMPWWDANAVNSLSVGTYLPFSSSAITLIEKAGAYVSFYNLSLAENLRIEDNVYQLVLDDEWTLEKMKNIAVKAKADLDGDTKIDNYDKDRFGIVGNDSAVTAFFSGADCRFVDKDNDGTLSVTFESEHNYNAIKYFLDEIMFDTELFFNGSYIDGSNFVNMFKEDRGLFLVNSLSKGESLRDMVSEYAILPIPKYTAEQKNYGCAPNVFDNFLTSVPKNTSEENLEKVGVILEALAAESYYTVIPAFYDQVLDNKIARDEQSKKMIDIIVNSLVWDIGEFYALGAFPDKFRGVTGHSFGVSGIEQTSNMASFYAAYGEPMRNDLASLIAMAESFE